MSFLAIFLGLLLYAPGGDAVPTVTDAAPSEYPYLVQLLYAASRYTLPGLVVSRKYLMTAATFYSLSLENLQIIDQQGTVRTAVGKKTIVSNHFVYYKVCKPFAGPFFNMSASSFSDRSSDTPAKLLFFQDNSTLVKKVDVPMKSNTTCQDKTSSAADTICMDVATADKTDFCLVVGEGSSNMYYWYSVIAIAGQVNGIIYLKQCNGNDYDYTNKVWQFKSIGYYRTELINEIKYVDLQ